MFVYCLYLYLLCDCIFCMFLLVWNYDLFRKKNRRVEQEAGPERGAPEPHPHIIALSRFPTIFFSMRQRISCACSIGNGPRGAEMSV